MSNPFTQYMLQSVEAVRSREFFAGMFFRFAFGVILTLEILALLFADPAASGDSGNIISERLDALSISVFLISTFLAGYWEVFSRLNRERIQSLQKAIMSSSNMDSDVFEFFEISRRYSYEVGVGPGFVILSRMEPFMWWTLTTTVGMVVLFRLGLIQ